jgi:hypothetical protein
LDGLAKATINLDLDSSAKLGLSLNGAASASTSTNSNGTVSKGSGYAVSNGTSSQNYTNSYKPRSTSSGLNGCVDVSADLAVKAGADGSFLDFFDKSTSVTLFQKNFDLFKVYTSLCGILLLLIVSVI